MSDPVARLNAALEGRYSIERELGEGGMATVYLADDLKHERKVALKVLKPELAAVVGAERFLAEIKTTANLQHPNILPLFDSGEADGDRGLVAAQVDTNSGFQVGEKETLFTIPVGYRASNTNTLFGVSPDDQRFLMARAYQGDSQEAPERPFVLVNNFFEELRQRVGN
jgi:serine/threonine protein kinase